MQPANQGLLQALRTFSTEIKRAKDVFLQARTNQPTCYGVDLDLQFFAGWYGLIGLHDSWSRFCKNAITLSALGGVVTMGGTLIPRSSVLPANTDPVAFLRSRWPTYGFGKVQDDGPHWYVPTIADRAADILRIGNLATFRAAILANADAPTELRACRNYLAHRHAGTEAHHSVVALRNRIRVGATTPHTERLAEELVTGNITLFEEWCIELENIATASIA